VEGRAGRKRLKVEQGGRGGRYTVELGGRGGR
jgi:hypothetical protein